MLRVTMQITGSAKGMLGKWRGIVKEELQRLIKEWHEGYGDIIVQLNVEDTKFGVAEYAVQELGVETIELKWGQGAKCIGGEIKVRDLDRALQLQERGYIVTPNPSNPAVQSAFKAGAIKEFLSSVGLDLPLKNSAR